VLKPGAASGVMTAVFGKHQNGRKRESYEQATSRTGMIFYPAGFSPIEKLAAVQYEELKNTHKFLIATSNS
jgi:hypothetical protein